MQRGFAFSAGLAVTRAQTQMSRVATWWWSRRLGVAGWIAVAAFAALAGRFWHPAYGFTKFLQIDETDQAVGIHELRENPIYFYAGRNGYDGTFYAQIAFHPLLDTPELAAIDNLPYRARRILGSAVAWVLAGGEPGRIANVYAALNLGVWLALAALLWRLLPVRDVRGWVAWAGLLFSAGVLHAVRLALTDLPGMALFAVAMWLAERGRSRLAAGALAAGALARETVLINVVALWRGPWNLPRAWLANLGRVVAVAVPLAAWMVYVRWRTGAADPGLGNFTWPLAGLAEKWIATLAGFAGQPAFVWLKLTTLFATLGLTVQAVYLCRKWQPDDAWWRAGIVSVAMMAMLGGAVWEGHPGAAARVLLPMSLAFAVLTIRRRAGWAWLILGNATVLSGVLALWHVPQDEREVAAGRFDRGSYVVRLDDGWSGRESGGGHVWAWAAQHGRLAIETWPQAGAPVSIKLAMRALAPRTVEIRQDATVLWRGEVGPKLQTVEFRGVRAGVSALQFSAAAPPVREGGMPDARELGFAVYDCRIE